jgi:hypothetical protein
VSKQRDKGTKAETAWVNYLRTFGFDGAERAALRGRADTGDVTGTPGLVTEVKWQQTIALPAWMRELENEVGNATHPAGPPPIGALVMKPRGVGLDRQGEWYVAFRGCDAAALLAHWFDVR